VFAGARRDIAARITLGGAYVALFLLGLGSLRVLAIAGIPPRIAIFIVLAVTTASNFLLGRLILKAGTASPALDRPND
jgi:hypothetical protein